MEDSLSYVPVFSQSVFKNQSLFSTQNSLFHFYFLFKSFFYLGFGKAGLCFLLMDAFYQLIIICEFWWLFRKEIL